MSRPIYPEKSWFDPRLEKRASPIHGTGIFATGDIAAGERIVISGGIVFTIDEWRTGTVPVDPAKEYNEFRIDEEYFLANVVDEDMSYFFNHSCDPNTWGEYTRRDITAGQELTADYAMDITDERYVLEPCTCGSPLCRHRITGNDWIISDLQHLYQGHFTPYIERRIQNQHGSV